MIRYVGIVHIRPESDGSGEIFPHSFIFPYTFLTLLNEGFETVCFDLLFAVKA